MTHVLDFVKDKKVPFVHEVQLSSMPKQVKQGFSQNTHFLSVLSITRSIGQLATHWYES
jgi:hypothetical protein